MSPLHIDHRPQSLEGLHGNESLVLLHFERPFFDSGLAGLTRACFGAIHGMKPPGDIPY
jgi:hypothetical protein